MFLRIISHGNLFLSNLLSIILIGHRDDIFAMISCLQQDLVYNRREKQVKGDKEWSKGGFQLTFEVITRVKVKEEEMIYRKR